jgi:hypothetical protein
VETRNECIFLQGEFEMVHTKEQKSFDDVADEFETYLQHILSPGAWQLYESMEIVESKTVSTIEEAKEYHERIVAESRIDSH